MTKITCVILGLSLMALGIIGVTNYSIDMQYFNFGAIVLGIVGLMVGVYAKQSVSDQRLKTEIATQKKDIEHQKKEIEQHKKQIELQKKEIEEQGKVIEEQKNMVIKLESSV